MPGEMGAVDLGNDEIKLVKNLPHPKLENFSQVTLKLSEVIRCENACDM